MRKLTIGIAAAAMLFACSAPALTKDGKWRAAGFFIQ
jgi:hypothetical protein